MTLKRPRYRGFERAPRTPGSSLLLPARKNAYIVTELIQLDQVSPEILSEKAA